MPRRVPEAGLVAKAVAVGEERRSRGPLEVASQRQGAGFVSPVGGDAQDGGHASDSVGGADAKTN